MGVCGAISACMLGTFILTGLSILMWVITNPRHRPVFYLTDFSITNASRHHRPPHQPQQSGLANLPVRFGVDAHNPNKKFGIYCKEMTASVYYGDHLVASGPVMEPSFYLAPKKADTHIDGALNATGPTLADPAWEWFADELAAGGVAMRLQLQSKLRFKDFPGKHHLTVLCNFRLAEYGTLLDLWQHEKYSKCVR